MKPISTTRDYKKSREIQEFPTTAKWIAYNNPSSAETEGRDPIIDISGDAPQACRQIKIAIMVKVDSKMMMKVESL